MSRNQVDAPTMSWAKRCHRRPTFNFASVLLSALVVLWSGCDRQPTSPPFESRPRERAKRLGTVQTDVETVSPRPVASSDPRAEEQVGEGLRFRNDWIRDVPWSVNVLKIDRSRSDWQFTTTLGRGRTLGLGALTEQLEAIPSDLGQPIAAINGDFYRTEHEPYAGDPRGLQIMRGELISAPIGKTSFWIDLEGKPIIANVAPQMKIVWPNGESISFGLNEERDSNEAVIYTARAGASTRTAGGREIILGQHGEDPWLPLRPDQTYSAQVKSIRETGNTRLDNDAVILSIGPTLVHRVPRVKAGDIVKISTAMSPSLQGIQTAIGGGPVLLRGGKVQPTYVNKGTERHPRSAVGWNDEFFYLAEVDGRQHGFSMGMTLAELATYLAKQGCQEAMNLDGGGSAEMWLSGQIVNRPCFGYERSTGNGLVVVRTRRMAEK